MKQNNQKLTILAFSDYRIHNLSLLEKKIDELDINIDIILYAGDDTERFIEKDENGKIIKNHFEILASKTKHGLGAVIGNDCLKKDYKLIKGKNVFDLHRKQILINNFKIIGFEGAEINNENEGIGPTLYKERYVYNRLKHFIRKYNKDKLILVSHSPPYGILDLSFRFGKQHIGSKAIRRLIEENDNIILNICGHSHINGGKYKRLNKCLVFNVSNHDGIRNNNFPIGRFCLIKVNNLDIDYKWYYVDEEKRLYLKTKRLSEYI